LPCFEEDERDSHRQVPHTQCQEAPKEEMEKDRVRVLSPWLYQQPNARGKRWRYLNLRRTKPVGQRSNQLELDLERRSQNPAATTEERKWIEFE